MKVQWQVNLNDSYNKTIVELQKFTDRIEDLQIKIRGIAAELPTPSHEIRQLESLVEQLNRDVEEAKARRAEASARLRKLLTTKNKIIVRHANNLTKKFSK